MTSQMSTSGWVFMIVSWAAILGVAVYCLIRTLRSKKSPDGPDEPPPS